MTPKCSADGCDFAAWCKGMCRTHYARQRWARADVKAKSREAGKIQDRKPARRKRQAEDMRERRTGFSPALVAHIRDLQGGGCAICGRIFSGVGIAKECADHCHRSGEPRGLLCQICNLSLGGYEKYQRHLGVRFETYEKYLESPSTMWHFVIEDESLVPLEFMQLKKEFA